MKKFNEFLNEDDDNNIINYQIFLKNTIQACKNDFKMTNEQAVEYTIHNNDILKHAWENNYTIKESITSTKVNGIVIKDDIVNESHIFKIDDDYEMFIEKINTSNDTEIIKSYVNEYYNLYNKPYSDKRIFERVKNNLIQLTKLSDKKIYEMKYSTDDNTINVEVIERDDTFIDSIINIFSFGYKKRKEYYIKPINISGKTLLNDYNLKVELSNKDYINISYTDDELCIKINDKVVYHMDEINKSNIIDKLSNLYHKHLIDQNYTIIKKTNPFI